MFTLPKLNLERKNLLSFLFKMQVDVSKSCQETDLVDLEVPTDEISLRRLELLVGVLKRVRCVCSTYVYLSGWGTHGNCVVGSCAFSVGRLGFKRVNLVLSVCLLCVCLEISKTLRSRIHLLPFSEFQDVYFDASFRRKLGIKLRSNCCCYGSLKKIQFNIVDEVTFRSWNCYFLLILFFSMKSSVISIYSWVR